ncbi:hypothetical protein CO701_21385 [Citrobacter werkmanii]|nr:hypothetical protein CO701_21385 [Citrobacter werkmanii]
MCGLIQKQISELLQCKKIMAMGMGLVFQGWHIYCLKVKIKKEYLILKININFLLPRGNFIVNQKKKFVLYSSL